MKLKTLIKSLTKSPALIALLLLTSWSFIAPAADHNDPNAVNSIFSNIPVSSADLYGMFGYPSDDKSDGEKVVLALTFAPLPKTGIFDRDMLYKIQVNAEPRHSIKLEEHSLKGIASYVDGLKDKYLRLKAAEIRVTFSTDNRAKVDFLGFPEGDFSKVIDTNKTLDITTPAGHKIKTFLGGRDDPFFNDLPGFFRSINYGPQYYRIPDTDPMDHRELPIPKTLLEIEDNTLFNYDPQHPGHGVTTKFYLPENAKITLDAKRYKTDAQGNYRLVYSGKDAQKGRNINGLVFEVPLAFITKKPQTDRIVRIWGESWVSKASSKIAHYAPSFWQNLWLGIASFFGNDPTTQEFNDNDANYNRVDTVGVPFLDAGLSERYDDRNIGANNLKLSLHFVKRFGHLGWGFGPSVTALGIDTCFDHDNSPVSVYKTYKLATKAFPRAKKCFFQELNMPDDSWNNSGKDIPLRRTFELFIPNLTSIDMDTTGTWPFGRRFEDQVATRFLSTFLDMKSGCGGQKCNVETLGDLSLWDKAPVMPKNPPNPLFNDAPFSQSFPYMPPPWPGGDIQEEEYEYRNR
ncbi:hypothetical protein [Thalassomonas haliotis]|uniref:hypothetical protein n=1 Tax=Thalassomonas haliotis TaxID=485448 RepID=UPI00235F05D6|nr:hypothetical protein [Thalassomonas haliotis]